MSEDKQVKDVTPFEIIREVFNVGWEVHSADLVLFELDKIEERNEMTEAVVEAARKLNIKLDGVEPERDIDYTASWGAFRDLYDALADLEDGE